MIFPGLEQLGLCAMMMVLGASIAARTMLCGKSVPSRGYAKAPQKASRKAAVAQQRTIPKLRRVLPQVVAERVVAGIRAGGLNAYAIIPSDIDDEIERWCRASGVEIPPRATMHEALAATPGVRKRRVRLNKSNPEHAYIRDRQRYRGISNEYPTVYWVDDADRTGTVTRERSASYPCDIPVRTETRSVRSRIGQRDGQCEEARPERHRRAA